MAKILLVQGVEGKSIYINDYRVVGSKPWGGGKVLAEWECKDEDILHALDPNRLPLKSVRAKEAL